MIDKNNSLKGIVTLQNEMMEYDKSNIIVNDETCFKTVEIPVETVWSKTNDPRNGNSFKKYKSFQIIDYKEENISNDCNEEVKQQKNFSTNILFDLINSIKNKPLSSESVGLVRNENCILSPSVIKPTNAEESDSPSFNLSIKYLNRSSFDSINGLASEVPSNDSSIPDRPVTPVLSQDTSSSSDCTLTHYDQVESVNKKEELKSNYKLQRNKKLEKILNKRNEYYLNEKNLRKKLNNDENKKRLVLSSMKTLMNYDFCNKSKANEKIRENKQKITSTPVTSTQNILNENKKEEEEENENMNLSFLDTLYGTDKAISNTKQNEIDQSIDLYDDLDLRPQETVMDDKEQNDELIISEHKTNLIKITEDLKDKNNKDTNNDKSRSRRDKYEKKTNLDDSYLSKHKNKSSSSSGHHKKYEKDLYNKYKENDDYYNKSKRSSSNHHLSSRYNDNKKRKRSPVLTERRGADKYSRY